MDQLSRLWTAVLTSATVGARFGQIQASSDVGKVKLRKHMVETYPGKDFRLPVVITDDLGHDIGNQTIFSAALNDTQDAFLANGYNYVANQNMGVACKTSLSQRRM